MPSLFTSSTLKITILKFRSDSELYQWGRRFSVAILSSVIVQISRKVRGRNAPEQKQ